LWDCGSCVSTPQLEFHKLVRSNGKKKLKFLQLFGGTGSNFSFIELEPPTDQRFYPSGPVMAFVGLYTGGSLIISNRKMLIVMTRNTVDITPPIRVTRVVDLDGDKRFELMASDDRWASSFDGRGSADPPCFCHLSAKNGEISTRLSQIFQVQFESGK